MAAAIARRTVPEELASPRPQDRPAAGGRASGATDVEAPSASVVEERTRAQPAEDSGTAAGRVWGRAVEPGAGRRGAPDSAAQPTASDAGAARAPHAPDKGGSSPAGATPPADGPSATQDSRGDEAADAEMIRTRWGEVLEAAARTRRATWALVEPHAQPGGIAGGVFQVLFAAPGLVGAFENGGHGPILAGAIHQALGLRVEVHGILAGGGGPAGPEDDSRPPSGGPAVPGGGRGAGVRDQGGGRSPDRHRAAGRGAERPTRGADGLRGSGAGSAPGSAGPPDGVGAEDVRAAPAERAAPAVPVGPAESAAPAGSFGPGPSAESAERAAPAVPVGPAESEGWGEVAVIGRARRSAEHSSPPPHPGAAPAPTTPAPPRDGEGLTGDDRATPAFHAPGAAPAPEPSDAGPRAGTAASATAPSPTGPGPASDSARACAEPPAPSPAPGARHSPDSSPAAALEPAPDPRAEPEAGPQPDSEGIAGAPAPHVPEPAGQREGATTSSPGGSEALAEEAPSLATVHRLHALPSLPGRAASSAGPPEAASPATFSDGVPLPEEPGDPEDPAEEDAWRPPSAGVAAAMAAARAAARGEGPSPGAPSASASLEDDVPSDDDEDAEDAGVVGLEVVKRLLGATVLEEIIVNQEGM